MAENHHSDPKAPPRWLAPILLILAIIGFYWKLVLTDQYTWLQSSDLAYQVLPWFQFQAGEFHAGRLPLWDPNHWMGQPILGQTQPGLAYPLNWLLFSLPLNHGWLRQGYLHWYYVVIHIMAALFAYRLARDLGRSRPASVLMGLVFSLAGWMGGTDWPQMVNGGVWAPLVFLYLFRVMRGVRPLVSATWGGFFLGMAWLSGHHQIPIYLSLAAGGTWLFALFRDGWSWPRRERLVSLVVFWVLVLMTGALQTFPAYEYGKLSVRWVGLDNPVGWDQKVPYEIHRQFATTPTSLLGIVFPSMYRHASPFVGITALFLAVLGVWRFWSRLEVRVGLGIGIGGLLFALAPYNVFHGIIYALTPLVDKARSPSMAVFLWLFGVSMLAAWGLDALTEERTHPAVSRTAKALLAFAAFLYLARIGAVVFKSFDMSQDDRYMMTLLITVLVGVLLLWMRRPESSAAWCAVLLAAAFMIEVGNETGFYLPNRYEKGRVNYLDKHAQDGDIVEFLRRQPGPIRVNVNDQEIPLNFGDWQGIPTVGGYLASVTSNVLSHETHSARGRQLLGVGYAIRTQPDETHKELVFTGASGRKVFVNREAFPRAFAVHEAVKLAARSQTFRFMSDANFDLRKKTFVLGEPPKLEACDDGEVRVIDYTPNRVLIRANLGCQGMVVLSDTYYPGWEATVDGQPAKIYEAYALVRGVVAGKGNHLIEFRYRPVSVLAGAILTFLAPLVCLLIARRY